MIKRILASRTSQFLCLLIILIALAAYMTGNNATSTKIRHYVFDFYNKANPRTAINHVKIVDIDELALEKIGQWPWSRDVVGELVARLNLLGAKSIAFDMVFAEDDRTSPLRLAERLKKQDDFDIDTINRVSALPDNDFVFAQAIKKAGNVVTGFTHARPQDTRQKPRISKPIRIRKADKESLTNSIQIYKGIASNIPVIAKSSRGNGSFIASPDNDGIIRKIKSILFFQHDTLAKEPVLYPTLGLEALRVGLNPKEFLKVGKARNKNKISSSFLDFFKTDDYIIRIGSSGFEIPVKADGSTYLKFRTLDRSRDYISAYKILDLAYTHQATEMVKDKIILIGTSSEGLRDIRSTPLNAFIPGVEVHFNFIEQVLSGDFIFRDPMVSQMLEFFLVIAFGLALIALSLFAGPVILTAAFCVFASFLGSGGWLAYSQYNLLLDSLNTSLCLFLIFVIATLMNYLRSEMARRDIQGAFGQYISPDFMKELTGNPDKLRLGGEMRDLSIMFTDIRNFTTISESMSPEALINTMNDFLTPMSDVVMNTRGTIDKYMGDAMMAFWNAPLDDTNHARHAVEAALAMKKSLAPINEQLKIEAEKEGKEPLQLAAGIGINTGPCAVGNMGSKQRFAYSALGDAVNLASRLEGQTKSYGLDLLVGEDTIKEVEDFAHIEIDLIRVKGKTKPVRIFTVIGSPVLGQGDSFLKFRDVHDKFLIAYRAMDFKMATAWIKEAQSYDVSHSLESYYAIMNERIEDFKGNPPKPDWDGVFIATSK